MESKTHQVIRRETFPAALRSRAVQFEKHVMVDKDLRVSIGHRTRL
jgi:hypothetical protein